VFFHYAELRVLGALVLRDLVGDLSGKFETGGSRGVVFEIRGGGSLYQGQQQHDGLVKGVGAHLSCFSENCGDCWSLLFILGLERFGCCLYL
jgi:hypothetical protein